MLELLAFFGCLWGLLIVFFALLKVALAIALLPFAVVYKITRVFV